MSSREVELASPIGPIDPRSPLSDVPIVPPVSIVGQRGRNSATSTNLMASFQSKAGDAKAAAAKPTGGKRRLSAGSAKKRANSAASDDGADTWEWTSAPLRPDQLRLPQGYRLKKGRVYYSKIHSVSTGLELRVGDSVHMRSPDDEATKPYVAVIVAMFEAGQPDANGEPEGKMIIIDWLFRPEEIKGGRQSSHGADELFIRTAGGVRLATYSIACVDERCRVMRYAQYCRYMADRRRFLALGRETPAPTGSVYFLKDGKDGKSATRLESTTKRQRMDGGDALRSPNAKKAVSSINKRNSKGETRLHAACCRGDMAAAQELLKQRAEVNVSCNAGWTPLHEASLKGHLDVVNLLIRSDADVNKLGPGSTTCLHDAVENDHHKVVGSLLRAGAHKDIRNDDGKMPEDLTKDTTMLQALEEARAKRRAATAATWTIRMQHDINSI